MSKLTRYICEDLIEWTVEQYDKTTYRVSNPNFSRAKIIKTAGKPNKKTLERFVKMEIEELKTQKERGLL